MIINKKKYCGLCCPNGLLSENQWKRRERQVLGLCKRIKKAVEHESDKDTNYNWKGLKRLGNWTGRVGHQRTKRDHPDYNIVEIGQNTEKSPWDLWRFAVTQTPVKDRQLMLLWKAHNEESWRLEETCCHSSSSEKPSANAGVRNSKGVKDNKRETESLLIAAQNNAIMTNHIQVRIDKTQQNSRYRLCGDRDETINHIKSECSKLAQTPMGFWDTNGSPNLGQATRPSDSKKKRERTCRIGDFAVLSDNRVKLNEIEKRDKYLDLVRELKKNVEHESDGDTYCDWCSLYSNQRIHTRTGGLGNKRTSGDLPNYSII